MVDHVGGYYGNHFKGYRGMNQGDPLYPNILNVVVDTVVQHWVSLVEYREEGP